MKKTKKIVLSILTMMIGLIMIACEPVASHAPVISPTTKIFNKDNPEDIKVNLDLKGEKLIEITVLETKIGSENYEHKNNELTIFKTYLLDLDNDDYIFKAKTKGGEATLTITVTDDETPLITPTESSFDKDNPNDVVVTLDLKGKNLTSIKINGNELNANAYKHESNKLTLYSSFLETLTNNTYSLVAKTDGGEATLTLTIFGKGSSDPVFVRPDYNVNFYNNADFHDYEDLSSEIEGQWPGYGIGDPFIMRFNGTYYLYVSTLDTENGIKAWKSKDLLNWDQVQGEGLPLGYVIDPEDYTSRAAYAPEVYYFNGMFYMYTSPAGNGHYIYTSDHPEGPFTRQTENIGMTIDGSVLIDDDETMYFTRANNGGIRIHKMTDMLNINQTSIVLDETNIGGWTEGSYILKRDGIYYLTYTGLHVASNGYRISYATAKDGDNLYNRDAFVLAPNQPMLLETENEHFRGLGHSATVMGPDMDSYYLVYHNLNNAGGPNRSLNIDRLLFNGTQMEVMAKLNNSIAPKLPEFYTYDPLDDQNFDITPGLHLSKTSSPERFTAEFNYSGADVMKVIVDYQNEDNYVYVKVDLSNNMIALHEVLDKADTEIEVGVLVNDFNIDVNHTIRVAQNESRISIFFDNMQKIKDAQVSLKGGKIGYNYDGSVELGYTAFSHVSYGLSDELEVKQSNRHVLSNLYSDKYSKEPQINMLDSGKYAGINQVTLENKGDQATYLVNFDEDGFYGINITYKRTEGGKRIGVKVDDSDVMMVTLPIVNTQSEYVTALVTEFDVISGINQIRLENVDESVSFVSFTFFKSSKNTPSFSHDLTNYMLKGSDYKTIWKLAGADGHRATAGTRQLVYIGDKTITDFTMEVSIKLVGDTSTSTAGIVFRAKNESFSQHDNYTSIKGYYLSLNNNEVRLEKLNYSSERLEILAGENGKNNSGEEIRIKIVVRGNLFEIYRNDELIITHVDSEPFSHGHLGFYTNGAEVTYNNLNISK